jgi:N-acyl-D-aspartate/D-glutamate deacylase
MKCDLVIRGGTVVDGAGGEPFEADVAFRNGRVAQVGGGHELSGETEIDARGKLVTPGYVDVHTHYDGQVTWSNRLQPSSEHGVTTVIMGNCGVGFAPCRPRDRGRLVELMEGVEDIPEIVLTAGVPWTWESFPEYLDVLDKSAFDADVATMVPHAALRVFAMGERAVARQMATSAEIAEMAALAGEAIAAGAIGFGTSRTLNHRTVAGEHIPTLAAGEDELMAIAMALKTQGSGVLQLVLQDFASREEMHETFDLVRRLVRASGRPASFSINQKFSDPDGWRELLRLIQAANAEGLSIRGQVLGRPIGALVGHEVTLNPFMDCASYKAIAQAPLHERIAKLKDPELRARILEEFRGLPATGEKQTRFDRMYPLSDPPDYEPSPDLSMEAQAKRQGVTPEELVYDVLLEEDGHKLILLMALGYADGDLSPSYRMMTSDNVVLGLGDGGAHYGIICDASYPTSMLTLWTRDRTRGPRISIAEAVAGMTSKPAEAVGLMDRGLLKAGYKGDFNIIDYDALHLHTPHVAYDLPAGGRRLHQRADGYVATGVAGAVTYREGVPTGALPGRLIRGARTGPFETRLAAE